MTDKQHLKDLLTKLSYENRVVTLASGKKSSFYFDGKQTSLHPEGQVLLGQFLFKEIQKNFPEAQAIGGPTLGADPLVSAISYTSFLEKNPYPAFIIRKEPKKHGTSAWIEGVKNIREGMKVVIIEDVITTGGSALKAIEHIEYMNFDILGILSVIDREEGGRENLESKGFKFHSLFKKSDFRNK
jgi:orotate phosphoribosyltransferase